MVLNFADGIEIVVDDDKVIKWEQEGSRYVTVWVKEGLGFCKFVWDRVEHKFEVR